MSLDFIDIEDLPAGDDLYDNKPAGDSRRRVMNIFYLIDRSGSMDGSKIESINQVMPDVMQIISEISDDNKDNAEIQVSALFFDSGVQWMYSEPIAAEDFTWVPQSAGGGTSMGQACLMLEKALHRKGPGAQLISTSGHKNPAIILLSDGEPTDAYALGLAKLKENKWFQSASKVAFQIGGPGECNIDNLAKFTGNKELVIKVTDPSALKEMIKVVSAVVSKTGTQSASANSDGSQMSSAEEIEEMIKTATENQDGAATGNDLSNLPPADEWD